MCVCAKMCMAMSGVCMNSSGVSAWMGVLCAWTKGTRMCLHAHMWGMHGYARSVHGQFFACVDTCGMCAWMEGTCVRVCVYGWKDTCICQQTDSTCMCVHTQKAHVCMGCAWT